MTFDWEMAKLGLFILGIGLAAWIAFGRAYDWLQDKPAPNKKDKHDGWMG